MPLGTLLTLGAKYGPTLLKYAPAIKKGYDWLKGDGLPTRSGSQSDQEKNYINFLQSRAKTGLGQDVINQQLGSTSRQVSQPTDIAKANITGSAISQGIEGSGVVAEQGVAADSARTLAMANAARKIAQANQQAKDSAQTKLGEYGMQTTDAAYRDALANRAYKDDQSPNFFGTVGQIGEDILTTRDKESDKRVKAKILEKIKQLPGWDKMSEKDRMDLIIKLGGM